MISTVIIRLETTYLSKMQMNVTPLSNIRPGILDYTICVRVSRLWEFRGDSEENDVKHLDLVLIDQKANAIYAEIPPEAIPMTKPHLEEGNIVYMMKITVQRSKPEYRVVENPYMIKLNRRTIIIEAKDQPPEFPKYTFSLIPFDKLHEFTRKTQKFLDVIGKITAVSNAARVYSSSGDLRIRRVIQLRDLSGNTIDLSLSGKRALEFDGETVLKVGQQNHVIAIFVGTLMKLYQMKHHFLSGTSACRWYINQNDIPEIKAFQKSLPAQAEPIQTLYLQSEDDTKQNFEEKTLLQLKEVDPFTEKDKRFQCTVTIAAVPERQPWCYRACRSCNCTIRVQRSGFKCSNDNCFTTQFDWKYKIPFIGSDGTYNLEFILFEKRGAELIGKTAEALRKQYDMLDTPPEILAWIGHKFTFVVKILSTKSINTIDPSFEVVLIKEKFGKQPTIPTLSPDHGLSMRASSTKFQADEELPLLVPIGSKYIQEQDSSSQLQVHANMHTMDIDSSSFFGESYDSNKRALDLTDDENQDDSLLQPKNKRPR